MNNATFIKISLLALVLLITPFAAQPLIASEGHGHDAEQGEAVHIELLMGEFFYQVEGLEPGEPLVVQAGQRVRLELKNEGVILHEAMFGVERAEDHGYIENFFEGITLKIEHDMMRGDFSRSLGLEVEGLEEIELESGMGMALEFTVPHEYAGRTFEIGCFIPGHYEAGMKLAFVVTAAPVVDEDPDHGDDHDGDHVDTDGDGIPDDDDYCPTFPGKEITNGC